jgi:hypothetical protein
VGYLLLHLTFFFLKFGVAFVPQDKYTEKINAIVHPLVAAVGLVLFIAFVTMPH